LPLALALAFAIARLFAARIEDVFEPAVDDQTTAIGP